VTADAATVDTFRCNKQCRVSFVQNPTRRIALNNQRRQNSSIDSTGKQTSPSFINRITSSSLYDGQKIKCKNVHIIIHSAEWHLVFNGKLLHRTVINCCRYNLRNEGIAIGMIKTTLLRGFHVRCYNGAPVLSCGNIAIYRVACCYFNCRIKSSFTYCIRLRPIRLGSWQNRRNDKCQKYTYSLTCIEIGWHCMYLLKARTVNI
jgi:hypothetical protein